jgi:hypothetical protein
MGGYEPRLLPRTHAADARSRSSAWMRLNSSPLADWIGERLWPRKRTQPSPAYSSPLCAS